MAARYLLAVLIALVTVPGCTLIGGGSNQAGSPESNARGGGGSAASAAPASPSPASGSAAAGQTPSPAGAAGPKQFHLSPAAAALVAQAHHQAGTGDPTQASATLERALRIEPDNPLLWVELGRIRLAENNLGQADAMGRKALTLATGDADAQASARNLIADALRASGRQPDAYEAGRRAVSTPR